MRMVECKIFSNLQNLLMNYIMGLLASASTLNLQWTNSVSRPGMPWSRMILYQDIRTLFTSNWTQNIRTSTWLSWTGNKTNWILTHRVFDFIWNSNCCCLIRIITLFSVLPGSHRTWPFAICSPVEIRGLRPLIGLLEYPVQLEYPV
jgi:hypothetical protein